MAIINRLSIEDILNTMELTEKNIHGNEIYEFCDRINFIDVDKNEYEHCKYPEFYIDYYLTCYRDFPNSDYISVEVYYKDGDNGVRIYESDDIVMKLLRQSDIDEIYDEITELFDIIRKFIKLNKRNINIGYAFSKYVAAINPNITDEFEHFDDEYRKKVDKWLNG